MSDQMTIPLDLPLSASVEKMRAAPQDEEFGVLTEIDVNAILKAKLGEEVEDYVILDACHPPLGRSLGLLLLRNLVLRATAGGTLVQVSNPDMMVNLTNDPALEPIAKDTRERLSLVPIALGG